MATDISNLSKKKKTELIDLASEAGLEINSRMKKVDIIELIKKIGTTNRDLDTRNSVKTKKIIPLRRSGKELQTKEDINSWPNAIEEAIQRSIRQLSERTKSGLLETGIKDLESVAFARSLTQVAETMKLSSRRMPQQLSFFLNPIALMAFQIFERRYVSITYLSKGNTEREKSATQESLHTAIKSLSRSYSSGSVTLRVEPELPELLAILFDHLGEQKAKVESDALRVRVKGQGGQEVRIDEVLRSRRSAIRDWQNRYEQSQTDRFDHPEGERAFYCYPIVDMQAPENNYLVLLFVTPLDEDFVDEKVGENHRCAEICLGLYRLGDLGYSGVMSEIAPMLKHALGRVLFTSMHGETSQALVDSYEAQASILRYWVQEAEKGYGPLIGESQSKAPFDGMKLCESIVKKILCAKIPGAEGTEVFPFDRAIIFKDTGTSSYGLKMDEPLEMLILEASTLSKNPSDRGRYLTRRERRIRGTQDHECDASKKIISDENRFHFFLHGHETGFVLSARSRVEPDEIKEISRRLPVSSSPLEAGNLLFFIEPPNNFEDNELATALYNLVNRLIGSNYDTKPYSDPIGEGNLFEVDKFQDEFERILFQVAERANENGLYFHYEHGLNLPQDVPLLQEIQDSYFHFLDMKLREIDEQNRSQGLRQEGLDPSQIDMVLEREKLRRRELRNRRQAKSIQNHDDKRAVSRKQTAKVVFISFSWELHDENMQMLLKKSGESNVDQTEHSPILGEEYSITMILVADHDPEKSISKVTSERENLGLFFQLIMDRIWMDKKSEYEYLERRSKTIGEGLRQFLHRAKSLLGDNPEEQQELDNLISSLKKMIQPESSGVRWRKINSTKEVFALLLDRKTDVEHEQDWTRTRLMAQARRWFSWPELDESPLQIEVLRTRIPSLDVMWSEAVVADSFFVVLKNACEAALAAKNDPEPNVTVQIQATPTSCKGTGDHWSLEIIVENTGGPIPEEVLRTLNNPTPQPMGRDSYKKGSTGVGIYLSRFQLQNVVGDGADLMFVNTESNRVQARIRLPARTSKVASDQSTVSKMYTGLMAPEKEYLLYVEDNAQIYQKVLSSLEPLLGPSRFDLIHSKGYERALELAEKRLPKIVFADMQILRQEFDGAAPSRANGIRLIHGLLTLTKKKGARPPIWILTGEDESTVRDDLGDITEYDYRFVPTEDATADGLAASGMIATFPRQKRPDRIQQLNNVLAILADIDLERTVQKNTCTTFTIQFRGNTIEELSDVYNAKINRNTKIPAVCILESDGKSPGDLVMAISNWFTHRGLPVESQPSPTEIRSYRLVNHVWHKRLILLHKTRQETFSTLPLDFLYWGLTRNIWISHIQPNPEQLGRDWIAIRQEDAGPLSQLRHDLINQWSNQTHSTMLKSTIEVINSCEESITIPVGIRQEIETLLLNGKNENQIFDMIQRSAEELEKTRLIVRQGLDHLDRKLGEMAEQEQSLWEEITQQRRMVRVLSKYLGGE